MENDFGTPENPKEGKHGQSFAPIISFIDFSHFVFDLLHTNLRISEKIFEDFFTILVNEDFINRNEDKQNKRSLYWRSDKFIKFLVEIVRISTPTFGELQKRKLKSFNRNQNLQILLTPLTTMFPEILNAIKHEKIWREFHEILTNLSLNNWDHEKIKKRTQEWGDLYVELNGKLSPTPYMHMLWSHLHELQAIHGNFNRFNCEKLEKRNHLNKQ
jgi:hypothetical protein